MTNYAVRVTQAKSGLRRTPAPDDEGSRRTRERILSAALAEFGAKGYAGARTATIGARAGVNPQLISYYFGGKQGLLDELRRRWAATEPERSDPEMSFAEGVRRYLNSTLDEPDWARLVVWQALGDDPGGADPVAVQRERLRPAVARVRRRQRSGELTSTVDPEFILLLAYAIAFAPIAMPQVVAGLFGIDPLSAAYRRRCLRQLLTLVEGKVEG
jgi:TetR/AcrR family transcriptional regulator